MIKILMLGDVVGTPGCSYLSEKRRLSSFVRENGIDLVIANGENSAPGNGMTPQSVRDLRNAGVDIVTGGNHSWKRKEILSLLDDEETVLRPANYPDAAAGHGYTVIDIGKARVLVINLIGRISMDPVDSPFVKADMILKKESGRYDLAVVDFHAEATSEKQTLARYLDGRIGALAGTHTHVETADEQILPGGSGYITDLGMCGSHAGVIGISYESALHVFTVQTPTAFSPCEGNDYASGCVFSFREGDLRCIEALRVRF
ncbi:MAG: YmdB family metallophosphoesterase [Clostridia bacterium]|nr:YmdB family metallophosphoesterase [Clostridia bacterium]